MSIHFALAETWYIPISPPARPTLHIISQAKMLSVTAIPSRVAKRFSLEISMLPNSVPHSKTDARKCQTTRIFAPTRL